MEIFIFPFFIGNQDWWWWICLLWLIPTENVASNLKSCRSLNNIIICLRIIFIVDIFQICQTMFLIVILRTLQCICQILSCVSHVFLFRKNFFHHWWVGSQTCWWSWKLSSSYQYYPKRWNYNVNDSHVFCKRRFFFFLSMIVCRTRLRSDNYFYHFCNTSLSVTYLRTPDQLLFVSWKIFVGYLQILLMILIDRFFRTSSRRWRESLRDL